MIETYSFEDAFGFVEAGETVWAETIYAGIEMRLSLERIEHDANQYTYKLTAYDNSDRIRIESTIFGRSWIHDLIFEIGTYGEWQRVEWIEVT